MNLNSPDTFTPSVHIVRAANPLLRRLMERRCPEAQSLLAQADALKTAAGAIPDVVPNAGTDVILSALADGTVEQLDLLATLAPTFTAEAIWIQTHEHLNRILGTLHSRIQSSVSAAAPKIASDIQEHVRGLVEKLRQHPISLAGISNTEAALDAGLTTEWAAYKQLRDNYHAAYAALDALIRAGLLGDLTGWTQADIDIRRLANAETLFPDYLAIQAGELAPHRRNWPTDPDGFLDLLIRTPEAIPAALTPDHLFDRRQAIRKAVAAWREREESARRQKAAAEAAALVKDLPRYPFDRPTTQRRRTARSNR